MLLTIPQPSKTEFGSRTTHDFSPRFALPKPHASPNPKVDSPVTSLQASITEKTMTTPHRGLPPPSAMSLPDLTRAPPSQPGPPPLSQPLGAIPQPPNQWHGQEDSMRNWLAAKAEEDKRKQEEEKTRQETLKLEQRRVEQSMLRESLQGGVPPQMIPMIYAGMGGANMAQISVDWLHQYAAQLQTAHQGQIMQASPEMRRDSRMIGQPPGTFQAVQPAPPPPQVLPSQRPEQVQPQQPAPLQTTFAAFQPTGRPAPTSAPRSATHTQLPRLTTNEMYVHQPPPNNPGSAHPLQQSQTLSDQPASSPSIYFHHWVPPSENKSNNPQTPASKGNGSGGSGGSNAEPTSAHPGPDSGEYRESPRKRKAQGGHQPNPPPSSVGTMNTSPSFSSQGSGHGRKGGHQRSRSNASMRDADSRSDSRRDGESFRHPPHGSPDERKGRPASERSFSGSERERAMSNARDGHR